MAWSVGLSVEAPILKCMSAHVPRACQSERVLCSEQCSRGAFQSAAAGLLVQRARGPEADLGFVIYGGTTVAGTPGFWLV